MHSKNDNDVGHFFLITFSRIDFKVFFADSVAEHSPKLYVQSNKNTIFFILSNYPDKAEGYIAVELGPGRGRVNGSRSHLKMAYQRQRFLGKVSVGFHRHDGQRF